ncbi:class II glutamine amidotransferase [Streptomyces sp. NBC_00075]|uniref:class II glutamine amidotransferase n=1 Tax=Streptomyces sp. NBC_00075 TaxID=2975641 RepID=UPI003245C33A
MCRMILASGSFDVADILAAAVTMSRGESADHDNATVCHAHGWGVVWRDGRTGELGCHRDVRPAWQGVPDSPLTDLKTDFLAIHVRNATLPEKQGLRFTHPLTRAADDWYFMHNGYMPTVHRLLGMEHSEFDSAEYFDYLIPPGTAALGEEVVLEQLRAVPPGGSTSGNAIAVHRRGASIVHWSPGETPTPRFFTLHEFVTPKVHVVSSERVPALAEPPLWRALAPGRVLTLPFPPREII